MCTNNFIRSFETITYQGKQDGVKLQKTVLKR